MARLAAGWGSVILFQLYGYGWLESLGAPVWTGFLFVWLLGVIVWMAFGVVHEAEELAHMLGEPYGTLILTLSIVIIEVALISAVMLGSEAPTLGRDTMFAVLMIVLNGVVGLGLLVGGKRHGEQVYNLQGAAAYLAVMIPLCVIALVLPNFTTSTVDGSLSRMQAIFFSLFTIALYVIFLVLQTGRHKGFFLAPEHANPGEAAHGAPSDTPDAVHDDVSVASVSKHIGLLILNILPIVLLSKSLAEVLDFGIAALEAPAALGGILIAMVVFTPEGISALKAISQNQLQRAINLCLGAATSTLGLTVPAVLAIGLLTGSNVVLGLSPANMVLLVTTLILSSLTFSGPRTTMLEGAVHLTMFLVFMVLVFSP
ncbi:calcium:proton antiporter [Aurantimonas sp. Leaf443]|nr:calcium:proton antiporter [Aurantimonas sp. Leaf443]